MPRAQGHCLFLNNPTSPRKAGVSQQGSSTAVEGSACSPAPPQSWLSYGFSASAMGCCALGPTSPTVPTPPGWSVRQPRQPQTGCAPTSCLSPRVLSAAERHILSRSSSLASPPPPGKVTGGCASKPSHLLLEAACTPLSPLSPRPRVCVPANVEAVEKLLIETKDQAGL